jgi:hypothetical protein
MPTAPAPFSVQRGPHPVTDASHIGPFADLGPLLFFSRVCVTHPSPLQGYEGQSPQQQHESLEYPHQEMMYPPTLVSAQAPLPTQAHTHTSRTIIDGGATTDRRGGRDSLFSLV